MRDLLVLIVHLITTVFRLARRGGLRAVVAESVLPAQNYNRLGLPIDQLWSRKDASAQAGPGLPEATLSS
jgi:hypothetical protein